MDRVVGDDGNISDLPWTAVFDPVANARALSAIQAEGFRAAAKLVDRFVAIAETKGNVAEENSSRESNGGVDSDSAPAAPNSDVNLILSSWWSIWGRLLRSMPGTNGGGSDAAGFELTADHTEGVVQLSTDGIDCAEGEVWLHNSGAEDLPDVRLLCGDLLSHDGHVIASGAVQFRPDCVPMPARSSRGVTVEVTVPEDVPRGRYRGSVLAKGHPELWMPVVLTIRARGE